MTFPESPSRPGRLVAATAGPGRRETPGTDLGRRGGFAKLFRDLAVIGTPVALLVNLAIVIFA